MASIKLTIDCKKTTCGHCIYLTYELFSMHCDLFRNERNLARTKTTNRSNRSAIRSATCLNAELELNKERDNKE